MAAVGAQIDRVQSELESELKTLGYRPEVIRLSSLTRGFAGLATPYPKASATEAERIDALMSRGDEARAAAGRNDVLALAAAAAIRDRRKEAQKFLRGRAFILRQLKRPEEVFLLRETYGDGFHLIGVHASRMVREDSLRQRGMNERDIDRLIQRDEHEDSGSGQQLRNTYHLADVFVDASAPGKLHAELRRFCELLFGREIRTPTPEEFGMFQAFASSLRSSQLGRQVGAAILDASNELLAVGANEVPKAGGGSYWEGDPNDQRDHHQFEDSTYAFRREIVWDVVERLTPDWESLSTAERVDLQKRALGLLRTSMISSLTEFGRAVHAEADAILSAARKGLGIGGARLYCTTFPCHVCAKHIVGAGLSEVVYMEPYPKSKALALHQDSIVLDRPAPNRVCFRPFVGIAPRRYGDLFSMRSPEGREVARKDDEARPLRGVTRMRLRMPDTSALDRETAAANAWAAVART